MATCKNPACDVEVIQGPRSRNPKRWCSESCRRRVWRQDNPEKYAAALARSVARAATRAYLGCCAECGGPAATNAQWCSARACQLARKRVRGKAAYAAAPGPHRDRAAAYRAGWTAVERERAAAGTRARKKARGRTESIRAAEARRRARKLATTIEKFSHGEIFDRDGWRCGICHEPIDRSFLYPAPLSVSLDHVIPLSLGGPHTPANVRAAHLECNVQRGAARAETLQLALV